MGGLLANAVLIGEPDPGRKNLNESSGMRSKSAVIYRLEQREPMTADEEC